MGERKDKQMGYCDTINDTSSPSVAIIRTLADAKGVDPLELPVLYDVVDLEAMDEILTGSGTSSIKFSYDGLNVLIKSDGCILIQDGNEQGAEPHN
ncbi:HalOD1 output domain-containing protein [Halalkalicoccus salilacus]|uniref:HalOD1 output domain-containing protein n=1 Tax=Halalkalicoccus TaxID=332246 RepID=UPI002F96B27D